MTRKEIKELIMAILGQADYDLMKAFDPKTAEEPAYARSEMERMIDFIDNHLKTLEEKKTKKITKKVKRSGGIPKRFRKLAK